MGLTLLGAAGMGAMGVAAADPVCFKDYPIPTTAVDYRQEFADGTLLPDRITLNGQVIKLGMTPAALKAVLGEPTSQGVAQPRSALEQCHYLLRLLQEHPTSMHLYKLAVLQLKNLSGVFAVSEWDLASVGTIKSFWYTSPQSTREASYLYVFSPTAVPAGAVEGGDTTLVRAGPPRMEWDIDRNQLKIVAVLRDHGAK